MELLSTARVAAWARLPAGLARAGGRLLLRGALLSPGP